MENCDFGKLLEEYKKIIWPIIGKNLKTVVDFEKFCQPNDKYQYLVDFHQEMYEAYPKRMGKYFRPAMVMLSGEAMGADREKLLNTAAAQQLSEEWILIHDDMEDDSDQRRGGPTLHQMYSKELAINTGDALHVLMWTMLQNNRNIIGDQKTFEIMGEFSKMLNRTVLGQTIEIKWTQENKKDLKDEDILLILESKTGYYTVAGPMREGAIIAGANQEQLEKIYEFGKLTGYCFQIKDDLLDLTSDFCGQKKQCGNDIYEGKRTIMLAQLLRIIKGDDKEKLDEILEKDRYHKNPEEVEWVIKKMEEYGSLDYADRLMRKFAEEAKRYFTKNLDFLKEKPARAFLEYLPEFLVNRDH
ncbi:MAG: polyprenyl synthetase family protein [Candidatus Shapirobacteria bacterium]|jgi:geranylgeranyl diphosphate synthase type II